MLHCSQGKHACGTSRGRALKQPARLRLQAPAPLCSLIGPTPTGSAHSGDTKGGCPKGGRLLRQKDRSQQLHSVGALPAGHWGWGWAGSVSVVVKVSVRRLKDIPRSSGIEVWFWLVLESSRCYAEWVGDEERLLIGGTPRMGKNYV